MRSRRCYTTLGLAVLLAACSDKPAAKPLDDAAPPDQAHDAATDAAADARDAAVDAQTHKDADLDERDAGADAGPLVTLLDDPLGAFPAQLSALGLYPDPALPDVVDERVRGYEPRWPLWSNGSEKKRYAYLPEKVDASDREAWSYGQGTLFFKTFFFGTGDARKPVETRVMRLSAEGWEFATYQWNADASDGELLDGKSDVPVMVEHEGAAFEHEIPSRIACRACHESAPSFVLGFSELQLNHQGQLESFADLLEPGAPADPDAIDVADETEREVLGYLAGNCVHCHNGTGKGPNSVFDLRHDAALANLINQETDSSATAFGIRVIPGDPDASIFMRGFVRDDGEAKAMPPLGVQLRDEQALELFRTWIMGLPVTP